MTTELEERLKATAPLRRVAERWAELQPDPAAPPVTRFAPSPTGEMHLGHVVHALWVWGVAAAVKATVRVRMEDHDQTRCRPEYEEAILRDLEWLGFTPEPTSLAGLAKKPSLFRQSDTPHLYSDAFWRLAADHGAYSCTCTRSLLGAADPDGERRYPGTCRGMSLVCETRHVIRARIPDGEVVVRDLFRGDLVQHPQQDQGDVVVRDAVGQWTYQLSVVVDDMRHGVNLIVRGEDLLSSAGRQILLARRLGRTTPIYLVHHPLVLAPDGRKFSKRDRGETVRAMREHGATAAEVIEKAWQVAGLAEEE